MFQLLRTQPPREFDQEDAKEKERQRRLLRKVEENAVSLNIRITEQQRAAEGLALQQSMTVDGTALGLAQGLLNGGLGLN